MSDWTDHPLVKGKPNRAIYIQELREALDEKRKEIGLTPTDWKEPINIGEPKKYSHTQQMMLACNDTAKKYGFNSYQDILTKEWTPIQQGQPYRFQIVNDLRQVIDGLKLKEEVLVVKNVLYSGCQWRRENVLAANSIGNVMEAKIKGIDLGPYWPFDQWQYLRFGSDNRSSNLVFTNVGIYVNQSATISIYMDTTDKFHTYKVSLKGDETILYIDDSYAATFSAVIGPFPNRIDFGLFWYGGANSEAQWDYIYYYTEGLPQVGWTVKYEANKLPTLAEPPWILSGDDSNCSIIPRIEE